MHSEFDNGGFLEKGGDLRPSQDSPAKGSHAGLTLGEGGQEVTKWDISAPNANPLRCYLLCSLRGLRKQAFPETLFLWFL